MARKARRVGAYSRPSSLARVDHRTREGRFLGAVRAELTLFVGVPTPPQRINIELAAMLALRIALLSDTVLSTASIEERDDRQLVSWVNALSRMLERLGPGAAATPPTIAEIFAKTGHAA